MMTHTIKDAIDTEYRDFSMYVLKQRAIPSCIDGMKIVQRKLLYAMLKNPGTKKLKVAELGGSMSSFGYHHGETSAMAAAINMAASWNNNVPLFQGHGNFGSRVIQEAAAPRYIFVTLSELFGTYFSDDVVCDYVDDDDHPEPISYLPNIPWVLVNGVKGIAVGFATHILPRDPQKLAAACLEYMENPDNVSVENLVPHFPQFRGTVESIGQNQWKVSGAVTFEKNLYARITELPIGYDREEYIQFLNKCVDTDKIMDYEDGCSENGFEFLVKMNRVQYATAQKSPHAYFKLDTTMTENFTTLDETGNLKIFSSALDIVKYFCDYRVKKCKEYIDHKKAMITSEIEELSARLTFIQHIVNREINMRDFESKQSLIAYIQDEYSVSAEFASKLITIPIYQMTHDACKELETRLIKCQNEFWIWMQTTASDLFTVRLKRIRPA